jgi:hypothetical protein
LGCKHPLRIALSWTKKTALSHLQQEALARRSAGKPAGNTSVASATGFPRPSELFDNWAAVGLLIALGVIAVLLLRKRG